MESATPTELLHYIETQAHINALLRAWVERLDRNPSNTIPPTISRAVLYASEANLALLQ